MILINSSYENNENKTMRMITIDEPMTSQRQTRMIMSKYITARKIKS